MAENISGTPRKRKMILDEWIGVAIPGNMQEGESILHDFIARLRSAPLDEFRARALHFWDWFLEVPPEIMMREDAVRAIAHGASGRPEALAVLKEILPPKPEAPLKNGHAPVEQGNARVAKPENPLDRMARFRPFFAGEGNVEQPPMLIKGLLREAGVVIIGGQSQAGKSYVAVDLAVALATGGEFFGKTVEKPVGVIYAAAEGDDSIQPRLLASQKNRGMKDGEHPPVLVFSDFRLPMHAEKDDPFPEYVIDIAVAHEAFKARNMVAPGALIIDTVSAGIELDSEDKNDSVAEVIARLKDLGRRLGMLIIVVHHFGKDPGRKLRGGSAWLANSDQTFSVYSKLDANGVPKNPRSLFLDKLRGVAAGLVSNFNLATIAYGHDSAGDEMREGYIRATGGEAITVSKMAEDAPEKTTRAGKLFREAFNEALHKGQWRPIGRGGMERANCLCARIEDVRENFEIGHGGNEAAVKKAFQRELKNIAEKGLGFSVETDIKNVKWIWRPADQPQEGQRDMSPI